MAMDDLVIPAAGVFLVGFAMFSGGNEQASRVAQTGAQVKELRQTQAVENMVLQTKSEGLQNRAAIAELRFKSGCTIHFERAPIQSEQAQATGAIDIWPRPIQEGAMPIDWQGRTYSNGQVVCDASGGTGVIGADGRVVDYAFNGSIDTQPYVKAHLSRIGGKQ